MLEAEEAARMHSWEFGVKAICRIKCGMIRFCGRAKARPLESIILKFYGFKSISFRCRDGCMIKDTVVMLSECPNVRVHNACPAREFGAH